MKIRGFLLIWIFKMFILIFVNLKLHNNFGKWYNKDNMVISLFNIVISLTGFNFECEMLYMLKFGWKSYIYAN